MPEPFKNCFNEQLIHKMAGHFKRQWPEFDEVAFSDTATKNLDVLELKERSDQIMHAVEKHLPGDFSVAGNIILDSLSPALEGDIFAVTADDDGIAGWAIMPLAHYVGLKGGDHFDLSMTLFKELTKRFSSEFGVRFFLIDSQEKTLTVLKKWTKDKDRHVRRLVSEGTRPRLPWAMQLPSFIEEPSPVIELLELLRDDSEEYVRRSVANNLNDISKDHPERIIEIARKWIKGASREREKLLRHACRTLIKKGRKDVLAIFGYDAPKINNIEFKVITPEVQFGDALEFNLSLASASKKVQSLMIDYIIHHRKANGKTSPKVFKWRAKLLNEDAILSVSKKHVIKKISTRAYYPGVHHIEIMVNGVSVAKQAFNLEM